MKAARVVVLTVAIAAGGVAAMLAGRSEKPPEVKPEVVQAETIDVLIAKGDVPMARALSPGDMQWQTGPASASSGNLIRKNDRPQAVEDLSGLIARVPFIAGDQAGKIFDGLRPVILANKIAAGCARRP